MPVSVAKLTGHLGRFLLWAGPLVVGLAGLVLVLMWLSGSFESKIAPGRASVDRATWDGPTEEVHEITKPHVEVAVGELKASSRTVVSARVMASIEDVFIKSGDQVAKGDLLVRLDDKDLESRVQQAEESLNAAKAVRVDADDDMNRANQLREARNNAISQEEFDEAATQLRVAVANERRAEQALRETQVLLGYSRIVAPTNGRIIERFAEPGDMARPGEPLLAIYDAASLRLEAPVLEHLAVTLSVGDRVEIFIDAVDRRIEATIDEIVPQAEAPSRTFLIKAAVPHESDLYEGMFGRLLIPTGTRRHVCLPTAAIRRIGQLEFVDVVGDDRSVERRLIKTGRLGEPGNIEVLSGLAPGDRVALYGEPAEPAAAPITDGQHER